MRFPNHVRGLATTAAAVLFVIVQLSVPSGPARANFIFDYAGNQFTDAEGVFSTSDSVSGFIEFSGDLTAGVLDFTDVVAHNMIVGVRDLDSTNSEFLEGFWEIDSTLDISSWGMRVRNTLFTSNFSFVIGTFNTTTPSVVITDFTLWACLSVSTPCAGGFGQNEDDPGSWTLRESQIPAPPTLPLWLLGIAGVAMFRRARPTS